MNIIGFDTETFPISQEAQLPRIVCLSIAASDTDTFLLVNHDWEGLECFTMGMMIPDNEMVMVGHSASYDLGIIATNFPKTIPLIFRSLAAGRIRCTLIREKLLVLATRGDLEYDRNPDGSKSKLMFNLAAVVNKRFGVDLTPQKDSPEAWRTNYNVFDNIPLEKWDKGAVDYAIEDSVWALRVHNKQEEDRQEIIKERGFDPFATQTFRLQVDFILRLMSATGAATDPVAYQKIVEMLEHELSPEKLGLLSEWGIIRPAESPKPKKGGGFTLGKAESQDKKAMEEYIRALADLRPGDFKLKFTEKGNMSWDAEWLEEHADRDEVLGQFQHRQKLQKLVTTELPRMMAGDHLAPIVYPQYDCLKETGRTSSFSSKSKEYASFNIQNVDPRVRQCFVPRPGYVWFSIDYSQMELATFAQVCFKLFGYSVLRDKINAGVDVHAYTGAQLAADLDMDFQAICREENVQNRDQVFDLFLPLKKEPEHTPLRDFYERYRKFAKPVNLGYPGGLGPKTFVKFARSPYDVIVTEEEAKQFRELWRQTYPETVEYFKYINKQCIDPFNKGWDSEEKREYDLYRYTSPLGMVRSGCDYCACANGMGLQTPSAEGALTSGIRIMQACIDPTLESILLGKVRPIGFIHDEFVGEIAEDDLMHERMGEMERLMVESMMTITPDVEARANACLMRRWDKDAKRVLDEKGRLTIWEPTK